MQRKEKQQRIAQIYTDISYHGKLKEPTKESRSTVIRHLTGVRETSKTKVTQKETQKQCEKKNQSLYTGVPNSIESFSTEKLSK